MNEEQDGDVVEKKETKPMPIDPEERLDWDFDLGERPAPIRKGKILVRFRAKKAEPMPFPDPDLE